MTEGVSRYPLCWPSGRGRRPAHKRREGQFKSNGKPITVAKAILRLMEEVQRAEGVGPILSTNLLVRASDGLPRSGQPALADPAVALYFSLHGKPICMPCDTYSKVEQNIAALANHIEATRRIARYGVSTVEEMFTGFEALPAPGAARGWREVLGFPPGAQPNDIEIIAKRRDLAKRFHPDVAGGDAEKMAEVNAAADAALDEWIGA